MDLIDLELVVHIAEAGSITHGATRTHLTLPSASARIRALENATGSTLFTRERRGVTPTPTGLLLLRHARAIGYAVERMRLELAEHTEGLGASVRVLANTAATASALTPAVTAFAAAHPQVRVDLDEQPSHLIVAAVAERRVELGIIADSVDLGGLETRLLRADPLVVCVAANDPLAERSSLPYADLLDRAFVGLSQAAAFPLSSPVTYRLRLPNIDAVCQAVATGTGIAILPRHSIETWIGNGGIVVIDLEDQWAHRHLVICFTAESELSTTTRALRDHLATTDN
jgi:DNA-binding transcriptional LysR family regulator